MVALKHIDNFQGTGTFNVVKLYVTRFELRAVRFEGNSTGVVHVRPGQTVIVQHPQNLVLLVHVHVYQGGKFVLPSDFVCHDVDIHVL